MMEPCIKQSIFVLTLGLAGTLTTVGIGLFAAEKAPASNDKAVERTRQEIKMLDDLYKNAIVLISEHYVNKPSDFPADRGQGVVRSDAERRVARCEVTWTYRRAWGPG
jgi:hypothetical protein